MPSTTLPLDHLAVLQFQGEDARSFLQGQLTADLDNLDEDKPLFACVCNLKGRVVGLLLLAIADQETILAVCSAELADSIAQHLARYVLRAKVTIRCRDDLLVLAAPGEAGVDQAALLVEHESGARYLLSPGLPTAQNGETPQALTSALREWQALEMQLGIQWLDEATSGEFLPQMLGLQAIGALSFTKGCYPGQEVIARTRHLGRLKRHPLLCLVHGELQAGPMTEVILRDGSEQASAVVLNAVAQHEDKTLLMLVARTPEGFSPRELSGGGTDYAIARSAAPSGTATGMPAR